MASTATSLKCPSCAAPIAPKFGEMIITCEYCGSSITLGSGGWSNIQKQTMLPLRYNSTSVSSRPAVKVSLIAVFTAISLGTNFAMIDIPNVKLMDSFVFIAAFLFGLQVGLGTAVSIWAVYGFVNPYGQDDLMLLLFLMTGECLYALAGALLSRTSIARELIAEQIQTRTRDKQSIKYGMNIETGIPSRIRTRARNLLNNARLYGRMSLLFGLIGFQATFAYDV